jgi:F-type H+-transporting ATPase subunit gamma
MKAIKATRQVTKAMEMVAASKMRRAVQSAQMLRQYALTAWNVLERLADVQPALHPYLTSTPAQKILAILITSDRGLCGSLNTNILRVTQQYLQRTQLMQGIESIAFLAVGKKGQQFLARTGQSVVAAFPALSNHPTFKEVLPIARFATEEFLKSTYDHVVLLYPDFISALLQEPTVKVLLPFSRSDLKAMLESMLPKKTKRYDDVDALGQGRVNEYVFEPDQDEILGVILPRLTEMQIYQAVLEAAASEHSARMVAMRNATDNASELLDDLSLTYNRTRQEKITAELLEISAAKAALEG